MSVSKASARNFVVGAATPVQIAEYAAKRESLFVGNDVAIFVSTDPAVSVTNGLRLDQTAGPLILSRLSHGAMLDGPIWAISAAGNANVHVISSFLY